MSSGLFHIGTVTPTPMKAAPGEVFRQRFNYGAMKYCDVCERKEWVYVVELDIANKTFTVKGSNLQNSREVLICRDCLDISKVRIPEVFLLPIRSLPLLIHDSNLFVRSIAKYRLEKGE